MLLQKLHCVRLDILIGNANKHHPLRGIFLRRGLQNRRLRDARITPRRPEVEHYWLPFEVRHLQFLTRLSIPQRNREIWRVMADDWRRPGTTHGLTRTEQTYKEQQKQRGREKRRHDKASDRAAAQSRRRSCRLCWRLRFIRANRLGCVLHAAPRHRWLLLSRQLQSVCPHTRKKHEAQVNARVASQGLRDASYPTAADGCVPRELSRSS